MLNIASREPLTNSNATRFTGVASAQWVDCSPCTSHGSLLRTVCPIEPYSFSSAHETPRNHVQRRPDSHGWLSFFASSTAWPGCKLCVGYGSCVHPIHKSCVGRVPVRRRQSGVLLSRRPTRQARPLYAVLGCCLRDHSRLHASRPS